MEYHEYIRFDRDGAIWYPAKDEHPWDVFVESYSVKDGILYEHYNNGEVDKIRYEIKNNHLALIYELKMSYWHEPEFECDSEPMIKKLIRKQLYERQ